jgi:hypothetical protein
MTAAGVPRLSKIAHIEIKLAKYSLAPPRSKRHTPVRLARPENTKQALWSTQRSSLISATWPPTVLSLPCG